MNTTIKLEVPKEIPEWFEHIPPEIPDGCVMATHISYFGTSHKILMPKISEERYRWALDESNISKNIFKREDIDKLMAKCPIPELSQKEKLEYDKKIFEYEQKYKIERFVQWHRYYINTFTNNNK